MTAPAVETVMPPEGLRVTPAGTPVLPAAGKAVLAAVVVVDGGGVVVVVVVLDGGLLVVVLDGVVEVLDGVVVLVVCWGFGVQVRFGCETRGAPIAATGCTDVSVSWRAASARWSPTVAAPTPTAPTARAVAPVSRRRRWDVEVRTR